MGEAWRRPATVAARMDQLCDQRKIPRSTEPDPNTSFANAKLNPKHTTLKRKLPSPKVMVRLPYTSGCGGSTKPHTASKQSNGTWLTGHLLLQRPDFRKRYLKVHAHFKVGL